MRMEQQYMITIDNRFGRITDVYAGTQGSPSFIDDDQIANYRVSLATHPSFVQDISGDTGDYTLSETALIQGPRGSSLAFKVRTSLELQQSTTLFSKLGKTSQTWTLASSNSVTPTAGTTVTVHYIDTTVRVTGVTTGYRLDVPIRIVKKIS